MTSTLHPGSSRPLQRLFHAYYAAGPPLELPADMELREFAYQPFGSKSYVRHLAFQNKSMLLDELRRKTPLHLYYSSAKYQYPEAPNMDDKGWLGSDLIFDIDADHLPGCSSLKIRFCPACGMIVGQEYRGEKCPRCGHSLSEFIVVPGECLEKAAREALRLAERLESELGLRPTVYFSGHRGFHLHVECEEPCSQLDSGHRRELVDYLKGIGLNPDILFPAQSSRGFSAASPSPSDPGWRGLLGKTLEHLSPGSKKLKDALRDIGMGVEELVKVAVKEWGIGLDEKVTIDTKRLVRIPGSLHGKTGLRVRRVELSDLNSFKPSLEEYAAFRGKILLKPLLSIDFEIPGAGRVELSRGEAVRMEAYKGVYLAAKGIAVILSMEEVEIS